MTTVAQPWPAVWLPEKPDMTVVRVWFEECIFPVGELEEMRKEWWVLLEKKDARGLWDSWHEYVP